MDIAAFLPRLGLTEFEAPSISGLRRLFRAYVERVPYENLNIQLGRPMPLDPASAAAHVLAGRGGYCYTMNGALWWLLSGLGYRATLHRAGVQNDPAQPLEISLNHAALTVSELDGTWLVDAGLGDGLYEPLPLLPGHYEQGPFLFDLRPSELGDGVWRMDHDPAGAFHGMDFMAEAAAIDDFREKHVWQSTSPESGFVRTFTAQRRDAEGVDVLRGLTLSRIPGERRILETPSEFRQALADVFGLRLTAGELDMLWPKVVAQHESWAESRSGGQA